MDEAIQAFILSLAADRGASQNTLGAYQTDLRQLEDFLAHRHLIAWAVVTTGDLRAFIDYLTEREYAPTSVARKLAAVKSFFQFLRRSGRMADDPARDLSPPKVEKYLPHALTSEEVARLFAQLPGESVTGRRDAAMLHVLHSTGLRVSEMVAIELGDVDADLGHVRCPGRGGRWRRLPLAAPAAIALADYLSDGRPRLARGDSPDALFLNHHGERLTRQGFWLIMKGYARAAGIADMTPHTLRHSFALALIDRGVELRDVQELLGHANISTTQMYRHLQQAHQAASAACELATAAARAAGTREGDLVVSGRDGLGDLLRPGAR
jgi:integrase/recombinase XerD